MASPLRNYCSRTSCPFTNPFIRPPQCIISSVFRQGLKITILKIKKLENLNKIETVNSECCHLIQLYNFNIKCIFIWGVVLFLRDLVFVSNTVLRGLKSFYNLMRKENILKLTVFEHIRNMEVILCRSFYVHLLIAGIIQIKST